MDQALLLSSDGAPLFLIEDKGAFNPAMTGGPDNGIRIDPRALELDFPPWADTDRVIYNPFNRLACPDCLTPLEPEGFTPSEGRKHTATCEAYLTDTKAPPSVRLKRALRRDQSIVMKIQVPDLETGRSPQTEHKRYAYEAEPPMMVAVHSATEFAAFRARIMNTPGRYHNGIPQRSDYIEFHGRRLETQRQVVNTADAAQVRRMLLDIMARTTKDTSQDGRVPDIFYPYFLIMALGHNRLPCPNASSATTPLVRVREGEYFKQFPLCRYGFPYARVNFNVVSATEDIRARIDVEMTEGPVGLLVAINETALRRQILSKQGRIAENGHLTISAPVRHEAQIVHGYKLESLRLQA